MVDYLDRFTVDSCREFLANPTFNPVTRRALTANSRIGQAIRAHCETLIAQQQAPAQQAPAPAQTRRRSPARQPRTGTRLDFTFDGRPIPHEDVATLLYRIGRIIAEFNQRRHLTTTPYITPFTIANVNRFLDAAEAHYQPSWFNKYFFASIGQTDNPQPAFTPPQRRGVVNEPGADVDTSHLPNFVFNNRTIPHYKVAKLIYRVGIYNGTNRNRTFPNEFFEFTQQTTLEFSLAIHAFYKGDWIERIYSAGFSLRPSQPFFIMPQIKENAQTQGVVQELRSHKVKTFASNTIGSQEDILESCKDLLQEIREPPFKRHANKMMRLCSEYAAGCTVQRVKQIQSAIRRFTTRRREHVVATIPDPETSFRSVFNSPHLAEMFYTDIEDMRITYRGQEGVGIGVTRDFIQNCIDEIKKTKMFIPIYDGSDRMVINPTLKVADLFKEGFNVYTKNDLPRLARFVGSFFAFCVRHDFPIPFYFARVMVSHIIYKKESIPPEMYVFNYLVDEDPGRVQGVKRLLTHPDEIQYSYIYRNDEYDLDGTREEVEVTADTYFDYLRALSEHKFTKQFISDQPYTNAVFDAFLDGFYLRKKLQDLRITTREFDKLLCGTPVTIDSIREWVRVRGSHIRYAAESANERQIVEWFQEILQEMERSAEFPANAMENVVESSPADSKSKSRSRKQRVKLFVEFFMRLIAFWTGVRKIDMSANFTVNFERNNGLPTSHMCFNTLCLPRDVQSKQDLYNRLVEAAVNVEKGAGNY